MATYTHNLVIEQGATFSKDFSFTDVNGVDIITTNYSGNAALKQTYTSANLTYFTLALSNGNIHIAMDANTSGTLVPGRYVYDVKLTDPSQTVDRVIEGTVTVTPAVTP